MPHHSTEQLQVRIDKATKDQAKKVLAALGLDMSSAIKIFLRQVVITKNFPCEIRDANGFTLAEAEQLRQSILETKSSSKSFHSAKDLLQDALS